MIYVLFFIRRTGTFSTHLADIYNANVLNKKHIYIQTRRIENGNMLMRTFGNKRHEDSPCLSFGEKDFVKSQTLIYRFLSREKVSKKLFDRFFFSSRL